MESKVSEPRMGITDSEQVKTPSLQDTPMGLVGQRR